MASMLGRFFFLTLLALSSAIAGAQHVVAFNIEPKPLRAALKDFGEQAGLQVMLRMEGANTEGVIAPRISGTLSAREALNRLLADTGLSFEFVNERTVRVAKAEEKEVSAAGEMSELPLQLARAQESGDDTASSDAGTATNTSTAQESSSKDASTGLEEIVVTAQRREERLQDVPISITALSEAALRRTGADRFEDYAAQVPGIYYLDAGPGRSRLNMRAVQTTPSGVFEEGQSPTAIYIDDLPALNISNPWANTDLRLYDVERVEVLRGPQGTLFGSGAVGGAVRILTNKPDVTKFDASVETVLESTQGGEESEAFSGMLNLPLMQDKFALRVVGYYRDDGGYVDNTFRNEKDANKGESTGGRAMLGFSPTDDLSLRFTLTHQDDFFADTPRVNLDQTPEYEFAGWSPGYTKVRLTSYNLSADYDFGPVVLTSATTYADSFANLGQGIGELLDNLFGWNSTPGATFGEDNIFTSKTFAQELRLASQQEGLLQWVAGAFYLDQNLGQRAHWHSSTVPDMLTWSIPAHAQEKALFGELNFRLRSALTATVGARLFDYSFERRRDFASGSLAELAGFGPLPNISTSESGITPKAALSYKVTDDTMFYAQAAKGFRVGQTNPTARGVDSVTGFVVPDGWKSDNLWNYELGIKSVLFGNALRVNTTLFYIDWQDIPLFRGTSNTEGGLAMTDNAGRASVKGVEVELEWMPNDHLLLGSSSSFADAKLEEVLPNVPYTPGNRLPGTPEFSSSNYLQLSANAWGGQADAYLRFSHRYVGKQVDGLANDAGLWSDSYNVFGVRGGFVFEKYEIAVHVENAANSDAVTTRTLNATHIQADGIAYRLRPRTFGLTFRAHF